MLKYLVSHRKRLLLLIFIFSIYSAKARVVRLGFPSAAGITGVDFSSAKVLMSAVSNGDTVQVFPPNLTATALSLDTITKRLTWIGVGNGNNVVPHVNIAATLTSGADSSIFIGITGEFQYIDTSRNITFRNCSVVCNKFSSGMADHWYFWSCDDLDIGGRLTNLTIENSFIYQAYFFQASGIIKNCVIQNLDLRGYPFLLQNNYLFNMYSVTYLSSTFQNNFFSQAETTFPNITGMNNKFGLPFSSVFMANDYINYYYSLKSGSPAIGAGLNGDDIGMYGGSNPFRISRKPDEPVIYKLQQVYNNDGKNIKVTVSAKHYD